MISGHLPFTLSSSHPLSSGIRVLDRVSVSKMVNSHSPTFVLSLSAGKFVYIIQQCECEIYRASVAMARFSASNVNPDLVKERQKRTFDSEILTRVLDGGEWITNKRRELGEY